MSRAMDWIINLPLPFNFVVLVLVLGLAAGLIKFIIQQVRIYACHRQELEFKRELLDRGLDAEEIATVIQTKAPATDASMKDTVTWYKK